MSTNPLFHPTNRSLSPKHIEIHIKAKILYTINDVFAALTFIMGSILFFYPGIYTFIGTWLFLAGSISFLVRPFITLWGELAMAKHPHD